MQKGVLHCPSREREKQQYGSGGFRNRPAFALQKRFELKGEPLFRADLSFCKMSQVRDSKWPNHFFSLRVIYRFLELFLPGGEVGGAAAAASPALRSCSGPECYPLAFCR